MPQNENKEEKNLPIDEATLRQWLAVQSKEIQIHKSDQEIRLREIDSNERLSEQSMRMQGEIMAKQPSEFRKSFIVISSVVLVFVLVFMSFLLYLVCNGQKEFAYTIFKIIAVVATNVGSFFAGRRYKRTKSDEGSEQGFQTD